ncbi:ribbon-helix-helix domain-containing protein [Streptacidiphilus fuscans]|uniref:Ribbon-helix-helix protein, CopG family n=1 Tax=Streptacidiphilus fuscans TaxID=2789292 RepID=A0A931B6B3_9ACTN|nr:ribbon-helix-helix domain-containing protein [Streptacidiphilus fuscans]MBF9071229.1 ribbon-helix-helix protein, CopG family [Streptacidiphilus fuscans]
MTIKRITVHLDADDLAVLRAAARWTGVPLGRLLRESIHAQAEHLRVTLGPLGDGLRSQPSPSSQA